MVVPATIDIEPTHLRISSWSIGSARFPIRIVGRSPPDKLEKGSLAHLVVVVTSWEKLPHMNMDGSRSERIPWPV